jgi:hypothetical protein
VDYGFGYPENYLYVSIDNGAHWTEKPLSFSDHIENPDFVVRDGILHVVCGGSTSLPEIQYAWSADEGVSWSTPVAVSSGAGVHSQVPSLAIDGKGVIHVAWEDDRDGTFNVWYSSSTDGGATWSVDERLNDTYYGARVKLLADAEGLHAVWCQYHGDDGWPVNWGSDDYGIVWYRFSDDAGVTWSDEFRVSQNEAIPPIDLPDMGANYVQIDAYATGFCAMWQDKRDGNVDLYMRNSFPASDCPEDVNGDEVVNVDDLFAVINDWGAAGGPADVNADGIVNVDDLFAIINAWGPCPG